LATKPRYYWDACAWIALIQRETGRIDALEHIIKEAQDGNVEIWTSNFTLAEVYKRPCDDQPVGLTSAEDIPFEDYIAQTFVQRAQVDLDVGTLARRLLRKYPVIVKPQDGIHLATALLNSVDELHTFDRANLLGLSGMIERKDGKKLKICHPPAPPPAGKPDLSPVEQLIEKSKAMENDGQKVNE
jgi:predicted nucleic acid-binding protein